MGSSSLFDSHRFLAGGGQAGELIRGFDWAGSLLGTPDSWPYSLRTAVSTMLRVNLPMLVLWGEEHTCFYNDAVMPSLGTQMQPAIGKPASQIWAQEWNFMGPLLGSVLTSSEPVSLRDSPVTVNHQGQTQEVYMTFSYSQILNDEGDPGGILVNCLETTQSVLARQKLLRVQKQVQNLVYSAPVAIALFKGPHFVIELANERVLEYWGRSREQVLHKPLFEALPEARGQGYEELLLGVYTTGERFIARELPVALQRKGRLEQTYIDFVYEPFREMDGTISGITVLCTEITEQVLARREAEHRAAELGAVLESMSDGVYIGSIEGITLANQAALNQLGFTTSEELNRHVATLAEEIQTRDAQTGVPIPLEGQAFARALAGERVVQDVRVRHRLTGEERVVRCSAAPVVLDGKVIAAVAINTDITRERRAEEQFHQTAEFDAFRVKLNDALRSLGDPLEIEATAVGQLGQHLGANQVHYGETIGEDVVIHRGYGNGLPPMVGRFHSVDFGEKLTATHRAGLVQVIADVETDPSNTEAERQVLRAAQIGAYITVPLIKKGAWVATLAVHSISPRLWTPQQVEAVKETAERTWAAVERARAETALKEADQRKDEFLATLAHELRNPLAPIRNTLQILSLTAGENELVNTAVALMNRQVDQLIRLVDDLLDVSRISRGKVQLRLAPIDLGDVVRQATEATRPLYLTGGRQLSVSLPQVPLYLLGDTTRLIQVVSNLLNNAVKFTAEGGHVRLTLERIGNDVSDRPGALLRVRDDGIGIAADQLERIFELFAQADNSLERSRGGLGLGLTLVRQLVELHGGNVEAHSEGVGLGSEFSVYLPTLDESPHPQPNAGNDPKTTLAGRRILVVDDNVDAALTLAMLLKLKGHQVHTRHSGQAGIAAAQSEQPEIILLDIGMPDLNGYDTCRLIRQQPWGGSMVLIALTGYGQQEDKRLSREAGFDGHLVKPVDLAAFNEIVTTLLKN